MYALQWIELQCNHPAFKGMPIVQIPDVHAGNSCNVGTAYKIGAYVNPDHVGVDIIHRLSSLVAPEDFTLLDHKIRDTVPTGMEICKKNSLNEKELFRFLNSRYQKARSTAPDLINEVARIDARFVADFCRRIKLQEGIFIKVSELLAEAIISLNTARMTRRRKAGLPFIAVLEILVSRWQTIGTILPGILKGHNSSAICGSTVV